LGTVAKYIGKPTVKWHIDKLLKRI
jgi:hypothetical protein